mgnify:CR=1 FL=1
MVAETAARAWQGTPSTQGKMRSLIDPGRNFLVVERSGLVRHAPDLDWAVYTRIAGFEHLEAAPGIWVPRRIVFESLDPTEKTVRQRQNPPLVRREEIAADDWRINQSPPDSTFEMAFAPGVMVSDRLSNRTYQVAQISDQGLADQAALLGAHMKRRPSCGRVAVWSAAGVVLVAALGTLVFRTVRRRRRHDGHFGA